MFLFKDVLKFPKLKDSANIEKVMDYVHTGDFCYLTDIYTTKKHVYLESIKVFFTFVICVFVLLFILKILLKTSVLVLISGLVASFYFILLIFKLLIVSVALNTKQIDFTNKEIRDIKEEELPIYTIIIPLYREEQVINQIKKAMMSIDYPANKLDIIITLEEYDHWTIDAIKEANLPKYFKTLILPNVHPKTKPKALNVAFLNVLGEYLVIYDAEIIPESNQIKNAYLAFNKYPNIACFQTRLDHYNADKNFLTKLFNAEFSFYYDLFLPGLSKFGFPISLSGHSTHFRVNVIKKIGAWDPYNVAEDCDLGIRLQRYGFKVGLLNSISQEEATSTLKSWVMQRTRWMKGFIQTSIVHLRHPLRFKKEIGGWFNFLAFLLTVPGTVIINIFNLLYWFLLIAWFLTNSKIIQNIFPNIILYISVSSFILGNLIFTYLNVIGAYQRGRYSLVKYAVLSPIYWVFLAVAAFRAFIQIIIKPHHWEKTTHGTHLNSTSKSSKSRRFIFSRGSN